MGFDRSGKTIFPVLAMAGLLAAGLTMADTAQHDVFVVSFPRNGAAYDIPELWVRWAEKPARPDARFVVFRKNGGRWDKVREVKPDWENEIRIGISPNGYFCRDEYALRVMSGDQTLAGGGPIYFTAGAGAFSGPADNFVNLERFQIDLDNPSNQFSRDTCGAFASASALEAAIFRETGEKIPLSTQYIHHINKSTWYEPERYRYENQSSYWGGNDTHHVARLLEAYPVPTTALAAYLSQNDMTDIINRLGIGPFSWNSDPMVNTHEQKDLDRFEYDPRNVNPLAYHAARYGIENATLLGQGEIRDTAKIEGILKSGHEIFFSMKLNWEKSPVLAKTYIHKVPAKPEDEGLEHLMTIVGFDKTDPAAPFLLVKNSWGDGIIRISYEAVRREAISGAYITRTRRQTVSQHSKWLGRWDMVHDNHWRGELIIRRFAQVNSPPAPTGWVRIGEYRSRDSNKDFFVVGRFEDNGRALVFYIDFDRPIALIEKWITYDPAKPAVKAWVRPDSPLPGPGKAVPDGQRFEVSLERAKSDRAASGRTFWSNSWFDVRLTR